MVSGWIKLCRIPTPTNSYIGKPTFKNVNKIILPIGETAEKIISILEYDTIKDECTEIIQLQNGQKYRPGSAIIDSKNNTLYLAGQAGLCKFDLLTQKQVNITNSVKLTGSISTTIIDDT